MRGIQTQTPINQENSGGGLCSAEGRLLDINHMGGRTNRSPRVEALRSTSIRSWLNIPSVSESLGLSQFRHASLSARLSGPRVAARLRTRAVGRRRSSRRSARSGHDNAGLRARAGVSGTVCVHWAVADSRDVGFRRITDLGAARRTEMRPMRGRFAQRPAGRRGDTSQAVARLFFIGLGQQFA